MNFWKKIFGKKAAKKATKKLDTGLRGSFNGDLYIDKAVFFSRPEVIRLLEFMKNSDAYPK
ncbi:MAG: hypothetical protein JNL59_04790 [Chitinophagaceae bacterium]|nr:hypothetical protein [Chitinophagaceae bacterium]